MVGVLGTIGSDEPRLPAAADGEVGSADVGSLARDQKHHGRGNFGRLSGAGNDKQASVTQSRLQQKSRWAALPRA